MPEVDAVAVLVATLTAFVLSSGYYVVLGDQLATVSDAAAVGDQPPPWAIVAELARTVIVVAVVAGVASRTDVDGWTGAAVLGLALWVGFPVVLWAGAMIHEHTPWRLAAIHAGDWLMKLVVVSVIVTVWP